MDKSLPFEVEVTVEGDASDHISPEEIALVESQLADLMKQVLMQPDPDKE